LAFFTGGARLRLHLSLLLRLFFVIRFTDRRTSQSSDGCRRRYRIVGVGADVRAKHDIDYCDLFGRLETRSWTFRWPNTWSHAHCSVQLEALMTVASTTKRR
jgi:hypothetical protein